jgi:hypothetical protein
MDLRVHEDLKAFLLERAGNEPLNDLVTRIICAHFQLDPARYQIQRQIPGRRSGDAARKKRTRKRKP